MMEQQFEGSLGRQFRIATTSTACSRGEIGELPGPHFCIPVDGIKEILKKTVLMNTIFLNSSDN